MADSKKLRFSKPPILSNLLKSVFVYFLFYNVLFLFQIGTFIIHHLWFPHQEEMVMNVGPSYLLYLQQYLTTPPPKITSSNLPEVGAIKFPENLPQIAKLTIEAVNYCAFQQFLYPEKNKNGQLRVRKIFLTLFLV